MSDYTPKKEKIPREHWEKALAVIRAYHINQALADSMIDDKPVNDGQPKGTGIGDPVGMAAVKRANLLADVKIVDDALKVVDEDLRPYILENVINRRKYPLQTYEMKAHVSIATLKRQRIKFIRETVRLLGLL